MPEDAGMDPARIELIRSRARGWVANGDTPSLVLLVARKGVVVLEEAYGILRPSDSAPLRADAIFPVLSIAKPFTAAAVMCLVEDGLLSLKHPITDLLPEIVAPGAEQVLIADLLTHMSGYDEVAVMAHLDRRLREGATLPPPTPGQHPELNRLIRCGSDAALTYAPGAAHSYCNFGYLLLGDIVRRVSGIPLAQFVDKRIFTPLRMFDTTFVLPPAKRARRVVRRAGLPLSGELPGIASRTMFPPIDGAENDAWDSGASGAASTAVDIAVFAQMLLNGGTYGGLRVLSRASVAAMTAPQVPHGTHSYWSQIDPNTGARVEVAERGGNYGYGLFIVARDDRSMYWNGSLMGGRTYSHIGAGVSNFWVDPDADLIGVYVSVQSAMRPNGDALWRGDHFQDMAHAAILD